jgi:hypothetical protein
MPASNMLYAFRREMNGLAEERTGKKSISHLYSRLAQQEIECEKPFWEHGFASVKRRGGCQRCPGGKSKSECIPSEPGFIGLLGKMGWGHGNFEFLVGLRKCRILKVL